MEVGRDKVIIYLHRIPIESFFFETQIRLSLRNIRVNNYQVFIISWHCYATLILFYVILIITLGSRF